MTVHSHGELSDGSTAPSTHGPSSDVFRQRVLDLPGRTVTRVRSRRSGRTRCRVAWRGRTLPCACDRTAGNTARPRRRLGPRRAPCPERAPPGSSPDRPRNIPLERTWEGLVEVTQIERQVPLRRRPQTEVEDVRVSAHICTMSSGVRSRREVCRHDRSRPSEERPRRCHHATEANRHEVGEPAVVLGLQDFHGATASERRVDHAKPAPRYTLSSLAADRSSTAGRRASRTRGGIGPPMPRPARLTHEAHRIGRYRAAIPHRAWDPSAPSPHPAGRRQPARSVTPGPDRERRATR